MHALDAHHNGVRWAGSSGRHARALGMEHRGLERPLLDLARRAAAQDRRRPARPLRRALRGRVLLEDAAARAERGRTARCSSARSTCCATPTRREHGEVRRRARRRSCSPPSTATPSATAPTRLDAAADRGRPRPRALRAWYELFPRSWGGLKARRGARARARRARLRRALPAADPPDRRQQPQGPQQRARGRPGRPRLAYAIGAKEGGHDAVHPELGTDRRRPRRCARPRASTAWTSAWTSRSTRPPTTRG